ncbi:Phototropic-responsive NPH3 family protein [Zea mays]|uniref:Phototropic-responsive NPH3 family protein n=1 Tax=Zea mays TaxID=4577 RepID=A0A1D6MQF4_MAIZE|nr:Phototropic-responsive NPH3 family protein [Zea mays]
MPVRAVVQVLFSEHDKLNRLAELSASFSGQRSPSPSPNSTLELPSRCPSKREVLVQHQEVRRLRDDVARLQVLYAARCRPRWTGWAPRGASAAGAAVAASSSGARSGSTAAWRRRR